MQYQHGGDIYTQEIHMDYSANLNPLGLPDGVRKVLASCIHTDVCSVYPDSRCGKLREALGRLHEVPKDWIICGNGAADLVFGLAQKAGEAALKDLDFVRRTREVVGTEREWMRGELEKLGFTVYGSRANYVFFKAFQGEGDTGPDSPSGRDMQTPPKGWLYHRLLEHKVLIRSCSNYPGLNRSFYRVCVKTREENRRLMEYMGKAVKEENGAKRNGLE